MNGKLKLLMMISIATTVLPLIGVPRSIKNIILFALGVGGIALVYSIKQGVRILRLKVKRFEHQQESPVVSENH